MVSKPGKYDEGFVKGKKVFLIGALPVIIFLLFIGAVAYVISNFTNKFTVNDNGDICNLVRRNYPSSIKSTYPCDTVDKDTYWLVTFSQSANTNNANTTMSFKVDKNTKKISSPLE
jgi:anionic cell wall polymer biosynthesis LytR-Cps2A-Psr (LCP) family protein